MLEAMSVETVKLRDDTLSAFTNYVVPIDEVAVDALRASRQFLWAEADVRRRDQVFRGNILVEHWDEHSRNPLPVPHGLIHDWIGAAFIPGRSVQEVLAVIQDYDNHKNVYRPEVMDSRLLARAGNEFKIYLRLLKKRIITVVLDTYHDVQYSSFEANRAWCHSRTTQISEVEHAGTDLERRVPPDTGYGYLWRLYTYWRFEARHDGVAIECRAVSLTRDIPAILRLVVRPMLESLPRESLAHTLAATRAAVLAKGA